MNANEIEPGQILLGKAGEVREVIAVDGAKCWYQPHGVAAPATLEIGTHGMARWAVRDITGLLGGVA